MTTKSFNQLKEDVKELGSSKKINKILDGEYIDYVSLTSRKKLNSISSAIKITKRELTYYSLLWSFGLFCCAVVLIITGIYVDNLWMPCLGGCCLVITIIQTGIAILRLVYFHSVKAQEFLKRCKISSIGIQSLVQMEKLVNGEIGRRDLFIKNKEN